MYVCWFAVFRWQHSLRSGQPANLIYFSTWKVKCFALFRIVSGTFLQFLLLFSFENFIFLLQLQLIVFVFVASVIESIAAIYLWLSKYIALNECILRCDSCYYIPTNSTHIHMHLGDITIFFCAFVIVFQENSLKM